MKFYKSIVVLLLFCISVTANATNLEKIEASHLGARIATARVCSDLATYVQYWDAKDIFDEYNQRATDYLGNLKNRDRLHSILESMKKVQLVFMETTGKFNWNTSCRSVAEGYPDEDFL